MHWKTRALAPALLFASFAAAAAAPDTEAVEYFNAITGHYFVTATASEAQIVDTGGAGPGWLRTGRSFPAWIDQAQAAPNAQPVCRFYSSGANSHFYTASASECQQLKDLEAQERARTGTVVGWQFEGNAFFVQAPAGGQCPAGTVTVMRAYNNGFANGEGSNHRFVDDAELQQLMVDRSWISEGAVMCTQPKTTGTNANMAAVTTGFDALAATWTGPASWKSENNGVETRATQPLTLTIGADGALSGSGMGCTFTGQVNAGDGFRSLFKGTVSASGCTTDSFNGAYQFLHLERFGSGTLMVDMKREAGPVEAKISAQLTTDATTTTGTTPPPSTTPAAGDFSRIAGDWNGTVGWIAKQPGKDDDGGKNAVNRPLSLSITSSGALSGTGFGCTLTGTLATKKSNQAGFSGTVSATGCDVAAFSTTYPDVRVTADSAGRIEIDFKGGSGQSKVEIEGMLQSVGSTTPPPPVAGNTTIVGSWDGNVTFLATARTRGGAVSTIVSEVHELQLTIGTDGSITGSGFGCTFTGTISLATHKDGGGDDHGGGHGGGNGGGGGGGGSGGGGGGGGSGGGDDHGDDNQSGTGTLTATGCTNNAFNGTYTKVEIQREDGSQLEVEFEKENELNDVTTSATITGRLSSVQ